MHDLRRLLLGALRPASKTLGPLRHRLQVPQSHSDLVTHRRLGPTAPALHNENVVPGAESARATVEMREIQLPILEHQQGFRQSSLGFVIDAESEERLPYGGEGIIGILDRFGEEAFSKDQESCGVIGAVLDVGGQQGQVLDFCGELAGYGRPGRIAFLLDQLCSLGG